MLKSHAKPDCATCKGEGWRSVNANNEAIPCKCVDKKAWEEWETDIKYNQVWE